jgi:hypothetical protein|nr:MAG TPA: hypothetical protein [Caudoviricetes sp.]
MDRNNKTIQLAKKAADAWRSTDTYHQAAQIIDMLISALEGDPTLTPPNEPMTCDGCVDCKRSSMSMCKFCIRNTELRDYYRRPPEGEEDT